MQVVSSVLSSVFLYAVDIEALDKTPMIQISRSLRLKKAKNTTEPFNRAEVKRILTASTQGVYYTLFLFAFRTGARVGEILGLHWSDINWDSNKVTIARTCLDRVCGTPKNGKERVIDLSPELVVALRKLKVEDAERALASGQKQHIVFNFGGKYIYNQIVRKYWMQTLERAGIEYHKFYHIRHSFASLMIDAGVNPIAVQHTLGHHSATFTLDVYTRRIQKKEAVTACLDSCTKSEIAI